MQKRSVTHSLEHLSVGSAPSPTFYEHNELVMISLFDSATDWFSPRVSLIETSLGGALGALFNDGADALFGEIDERFGGDILTGLIAVEIPFDAGREALRGFPPVVSVPLGTRSRYCSPSVRVRWDEQLCGISNARRPT